MDEIYTDATYYFLFFFYSNYEKTNVEFLFNSFNFPVC